MKTVLVTGGAGFIGSNLVRDILAGGALRVVNVDKLTYAGNRESLGEAMDDPNHVFVHGSINDGPLLASLLARHRPVAVLNLAAESHVDRSIDGPGEFIQTNVAGTCTLLEAVRAYWDGLSGREREDFRFLNISTDEVYGSLGADGLFTEETPLAPNSPYSASKAAADHLVRAYHHTYGLPTIITRCSNNYGPRQYPEKLIPLMITKALAGQPLPVYGDGGNVRDWIYVLDHCRALMAALARGTPGEAYNIGGNSEKTNLQVVETICDLLDAAAPRAGGQSYRQLITFVQDRPGHDRRYAIDASKARDRLGWQPAETFTAGIKKTVDWYLVNGEWCRLVSRRAQAGQRLGVLRKG